MAKATTKKNFFSYYQVLDRLKTGNLALVYIIFGEEKYLHDEIIERILDLGLNKGLKDFNYDIFYANDTTVDTIINVARSYPMMSERRVVVVKDIQFIKPAELKYLAAYIERPSSSSILVLTMPEKNRLSKWLNMDWDHVVAVECRPLYDNEVPDWIQNYLAAKKIIIEREATLLLQTQVGNSLLDVVNELEKIQINIFPRTHITLRDVQNIASSSKQFNIFELCNAVGDKNLTRAISILNRLLEQNETPTIIIIQLTRHLVHLLKIQESIRQGKKAASDLTKITGLNYYFINEMIRQAKNFTLEQLRQSFTYLAEADLHLKTGYQTPRLILELLLFRLIKGYYRQF